MIRLVLGGEKSGKSDMAYGLFCQDPGPGVVMAMGSARDAAFRSQILAHRMRRDPAVPVLEPGIELPTALETARSAGQNVLVDSLDFWVFSCLEQGQDRTNELLEALAVFQKAGSPQCTLVSCEVGLGPIAPSSLARRFARALGALNQSVALLAKDVRLVVAGLPIMLKQE